MSKFSAEIAQLTPHKDLRARAIAREIAAEIRGIETNSELRPHQKSVRLSEFDADISALGRLDAESRDLRAQSRSFNGASSLDGHDEFVFDGRVIDNAPGARRGGSRVQFATTDLKAMHQAVQSRSSYAITTKAGSTVEPVLPPEYAPGVLGPVHEPRLIDKLPTRPVSAPVYEYIRHSATTGGPGVVAEMAAKPESVAVVNTLTAQVVKIATHAGISWETLRDYDAFIGYWQNELIRQVYDLEAAQVLAGSGTGGNMTGLTLTSGILTHTIASGETPLDAIETSISTMRTGPALAVADLLILNPSDWSKIRRSKDNYGRYLVAPDPTADEANTVWGVEVFCTTAQAAGSGVLLDTTKFGQILVRDGITIQTGTSNDDLIRNIQRFVIEERLGLAVERPAAVLSISGF